MIDTILTFFNEAIFALVIPGIFLGCLGIILYFFIPKVLVQYKTAALIASISIILFFVYQGGRSSEHTKWKLEDAKNQLDIAYYRTKSNEVNTQTVIQYVDRLNKIETIREVPVREYITKEADANCIINSDTANGLRIILNPTAKGTIPVSARKPDGAASGVK